jgi:hypothetical protein
MTNSWALLYDELYPMKESKPFQSNQFEVEKQRAMSNIQDATNSQKDWEDFWYSPEKNGSWTSQDYYNSESEGKDVTEEKVEESTKPQTFSYDGYIRVSDPYSRFGKQRRGGPLSE